MSSLRTTRDVYGPATTGGPIERRPARVRRLSAPRERTLTELGLRDTRFDPAPETPHHMLMDIECARLRCLIHDKFFEMDCGD